MNRADESGLLFDFVLPACGGQAFAGQRQESVTARGRQAGFGGRKRR